MSGVARVSPWRGFSTRTRSPWTLIPVTGMRSGGCCRRTMTSPALRVFAGTHFMVGSDLFEGIQGTSYKPVACFGIRKSPRQEISFPPGTWSSFNAAVPTTCPTKRLVQRLRKMFRTEFLPQPGGLDPESVGIRFLHVTPGFFRLDQLDEVGPGLKAVENSTDQSRSFSTLPVRHGEGTSHGLVCA